MKKASKNRCKEAIIFLIILGLLLKPIPAYAEPLENDPFASMYDSDVLVARGLFEAENRIILETDIEISSKYGRENNESMTIRQGRGISSAGRRTLRTEKIAEKTAEMQTELIEKYQHDRFIVRYKNKGRTELITLSEKVNPKTFADELKASGASKEIEYIQPDYIMTLAGAYPENGEDYIEDEPGTQEEQDAKEEQDSKEEPDNQEESDQQEDKEELLIEVPIIEETETEAWEEASESVFESANTPVIVAIIDTGIDSSHEMLIDYIIEGWNFVNDTSVIFDDARPLESSHGTHIAGTIAQIARETGAEISIMPLKVFDQGIAYTSDIIAAIEYAEANGAKIINLSFGAAQDNPALYDSILNTDALFICAAGNSRSDLDIRPTYPASYRLSNVISVSSVNKDGGFSYFSNYSPQLVDITAVGRDVVSTLPLGNYGTMTGTSMSAAYVSGVSAVTLSLELQTVTELRGRILRASDMLKNLEGKVDGLRRVSLNNAIAGIEPTGAITPLYEEDFDIYGYDLSEEELFELFSLSGGVKQLASGYSHTVALLDDGTVWAWGNNQYGQLGNGTLASSQFPVKALGLGHSAIGSEIIAIDANAWYSLALDADGQVYYWGYGYWGSNYTIPSTAHHQAPFPNALWENNIGISAGVNHVTSYKHDVITGYSAFAWGNLRNSHSGIDFSIYPPVGIGNNVSAIASGHRHSIMLTSGGSVKERIFEFYGYYDNHGSYHSENYDWETGLTGITAISSKERHRLALDNNGGVWAWSWLETGGGYANGQPIPGYATSGIIPITGIGQAAEISAGAYTSLAAAEGLVWEWQNTDPSIKKIVEFPAGTFVEKVVAGYSVNYAFSDNGTVWKWSEDEQPIQFLGSQTTPKLAFVQNDEKVSAGNSHSIAIDNGMNVWSWGLNSSGQLGNGMTESLDVPARIEGLDQILSVSANGNHSLALRIDGSVWAWGNNSSGQLGDGTTINRASPQQVPGLSDIVAISAGVEHSLALDSDGSIWAWGNNGSGRLGDGTTLNRLSPVKLSGISDVTGISAGRAHSIAITNLGSIFTWGNNANGQIGNWSTVQRLVPTNITGSQFNRIIKVSTKNDTNFALMFDGTVWSWGLNNYWQAGNGGTQNCLFPNMIYDASAVPAIDIASGYLHGMLLLSDDSMKAWGLGAMGQLGDGTYIPKLTPTAVNPFTDIASICGGSGHTLIYRKDGSIWGWGANHSGQVGNGTLTTQKTPVHVFTEERYIRLSASEFELEIDDEYTLEAFVFSNNIEDHQIAWSSNNQNIATIDSAGTVKGVSLGMATLTAKTPSGETHTGAVVKVIPNQNEKNLIIPFADLELEAGAEVSIFAEVYPLETESQQVVWFSSNDNIATITNDGLITAISAGDVVFTALTPDYEYSDSIWASIEEIPFMPFNSLTLDSRVNNAIVYTGRTIQWAAIVSPPTGINIASLNWISQNTAIAGVSAQADRTKCAVTGRLPGSTRIEVRSAVMGRSASSNITVAQAVTGVSLNRSSLSLGGGATSQLVQTVAPGNAYNKTVTWSSSNSNVATVSASGLVTARAAGSATITVRTNDGGRTATCAVTVLSVPVTGISLNKTRTTLNINNTDSLTATISPANATNKTITWSSNNTTVATVSGSGVITARAPGSATITARSNNGYTASCTVTVMPISVTGVSLNRSAETLEIGKSINLTATVSPSNATNKSVTWSSSNSSVATVSASGMVTARAAGTATITARTNDGNRTATCTITVRQPIISVASVSINAPSSTITVGRSETLTVTVSPSNATNKSVTWSSSNTSVASVSNGVVTARSAGTATITVKSNDAGRAASINITVRPATVAVTGVSLNKPPSTSLELGKSEMFTATISPANATNKNVTWASSSQSLVVSNTGRVTAVRDGSATISVTTVDGNRRATTAVDVIVRVERVEINEQSQSNVLRVGYGKTITATVRPSNATDKRIVWSSNNSNIATISQSGEISTKAPGIATMTVTTLDGSKTAIYTTSVRGYEGIAPPAEVDYSEAQIAADVAAGLYTMEDYQYLVALGAEDQTSYEGFYAVASNARNRVNNTTLPLIRNQNTYKEVVTSGAYYGYTANDIGRPRMPFIKNAAISVLRGGHSTIRDYCYFYGRDGNSTSGHIDCNIWFEPHKILGGNYPIVIGNSALRNVYYQVWESVHNHEGVFQINPGDIILYSKPPKNRWYDQ
ncbi:MAG: Ig-like domain-containing protein [Lachnospiraceae bacterium]|nr:Ig-like domain-containing protein [Lachnospiraceae bacterium]